MQRLHDSAAASEKGAVHTFWAVLAAMVAVSLVGMAAITAVDALAQRYPLSELVLTRLEGRLEVIASTPEALGDPASFERTANEAAWSDPPGLPRLPATLAYMSSQGSYVFSASASGPLRLLTPAEMRQVRSAPVGSLTGAVLSGQRTTVVWRSLPAGEGWLVAAVPNALVGTIAWQGSLSRSFEMLPLLLLLDLLLAWLFSRWIGRSVGALESIGTPEEARAVACRSPLRELRAVATRWSHGLEQERRLREDLRHKAFWHQQIMAWLNGLQATRTFPEMAEAFVSTLPFGSAALWLVEPEENRCVPIAAKGYGGLNPADAPYTLDPPAGLNAVAYHRRSMIRWPGPDALPNRSILQATQDGAVVAMPLMHGSEVQGILTVGASDASDLPEAAIESLEQITPLLGALLTNWRLVDSLRQDKALFDWMQAVSPVVLGDEQAASSDAWEIASIPVWRRLRQDWDRIGGVEGGILLSRDTPVEPWAISEVWGSLHQDEIRIRERWWPGVQDLLVRSPQAFRRTRWLEPQDPLQCGNAHELLHGVWDGPDLVEVAIIAVRSRQSPLDAALFSVLEFTGLVSLNRRRHKRLLDLSEHDPLTGVLNRRALEARLEPYFSEGPKLPALFVLVDIDNLKALNDTSGHQVADDALREFASYVRTVLRREDEVARIGGDEFVWLFWGVGWDKDAERRLQRIATASPLARYGLSVTGGVVELPQEASSFAAAYRLADQRLYEGKGAGKGRFVAAGASSSHSP